MNKLINRKSIVASLHSNRPTPDAFQLGDTVIIGGRTAVVVAPDGTNHAFKYQDNSYPMPKIDDGRSYVSSHDGHGSKSVLPH